MPTTPWPFGMDVWSTPVIPSEVLSGLPDSEMM